MQTQMADASAKRNAHQQAALAAERDALRANQAREGATAQADEASRRAAAAAVLKANLDLAAERKAAQRALRERELAEARAELEERGGFAARFGTSLV